MEGHVFCLLIFAYNPLGDQAVQFLFNKALGMLQLTFDKLPRNIFGFTNDFWEVSPQMF